MSELYEVSVVDLKLLDDLVDEPLLEDSYAMFVRDAGRVGAVKAMKVKGKKVSDPLRLIAAGVEELKAKPAASALPPKPKVPGTLAWVRDVVLHKAAPQKFSAPPPPVLATLDIKSIHPDAGMLTADDTGGPVERWALRIAALASPRGDDDDNAFARALGGIDTIVSLNVNFYGHVWEISLSDRKRIPKPYPEAYGQFFSARLHVLYSSLAASNLRAGMKWSTTAF